MQEVSKSKSLKREPITETIEIATKSTPFAELDEEVRIALESVEEKKAVDTIVLDLRNVTSFTEFFVITHGTNQRHVQAIADEVVQKLKKTKKFQPIRVEGYAAAEWILLDYGDFVAHVFNEESRGFYDLERLWRDAAHVDLPKPPAGE